MSDLGRHIGAVARELLGDPNARLSSKAELRFGTHGSVSVDLAKGTWFDHEHETGGGVLDLIAAQTGRKNGAAVAWLREHGIAVEEPSSRREIVALFDYTDEFGELLFQVVRFEPKGFQQRRPGPNGQWVWGTKGVRLVPYRLPELTEAVASERLVFVVEGEKKVDALAAVGVPATCNPMGAGKWPAAFADFFRGADVVILPDNDDAGRKHRDLVMANLAERARTVRALDLPGLGPKGDVVDWLNAGGSADALYRLVEERARLPHEQPPASSFGALWLHELSQYRHQVDWLVKGVIPANAFGALVGDPGSGKSFLALDLAYTTSTLGLLSEEPFWFGRRVRPCGVIYIAAEGQRGFIKRIQALMQHHRTPHQVFPFVLLPTAVDLKSADGGVATLIQEIKIQAARMNVPLGLVIVDTLNRALAGGDENSSEDMGAFIRHVEAIKEAVQTTVIAVHHKNAAGTRERGHSSLRGALDFLIEVSRSEFGGNTWTITKQKDEEDGITVPFALKRVAVGLDDDGDEITSCVVEPSDNPATAKARSETRLPQQAIVALRLLIELCSEIGSRVPLSGIDASGVKLTSWRDRCQYQHLVAPGSGDDAFRKAFQRAMDTLRTARRIGIEGDWVWPVLRRDSTG